MICPRFSCKPCFTAKLSKHYKQTRNAALVTDVDSAFSLRSRHLGSSDLLVSEVCLGAMTYGWQNDEKQAHEILSCAKEFGVNFFDTAEMYPVPPSPENQGKSTEILGTWLKKQKRDQIVVASKVIGPSEKLTWIVANRTNPKQQEIPSKLDRKNIREACEAELQRLQTDYIDLFQIHWPSRPMPEFGYYQYHTNEQIQQNDSSSFEEQVLAMNELIQEGKIRSWGLSNETSYGVIMHCMVADRVGAQRPISIQNSYSLIHRQFESDLAETCAPHNFNISLLPCRVLAGGSLSGKYVEGTASAQSRFNLNSKRWFRFHGPERVQRAALLYAQLAREVGMTPAQLAYAFCRSRWFVGSTIIGGTRIEQIQDNMQAFLGDDLEDEILQRVQEIYLDHRDPMLMD
eukprot:TRINITY_DN5460_c0_g1_i3.p1 TRINITY_DN5460_c0_g1~~TRINITY_DN5460_c0_g1_i3.p1  ORF type:complete len:402 (-),score=31.69 TRINITY_DN5460_c0_g1_i3:273-1478(-)